MSNLKVVNVEENVDFNGDVDVTLENGEKYLVQLSEGVFHESQGCLLLGHDAYDSCDEDCEVKEDQEELKGILISAAESFSS